MSQFAAFKPQLSKTQWMTQTALFLALALVLPLGLHLLGNDSGRVFLPMHIPVLLAGFLVGPAGGLVVGLLAPGLSHLVTGLPLSGTVPIMSLELPLYGLVAGLTYSRLRLNIYLALLLTLAVGRLMFGLGLQILGLFMELPYPPVALFSAGGPLLTGLPGIVIQLFLVPVIVATARRRRT